MKILLMLLFWFLWYINYSSRTILSPLLPIIKDSLSINHAMAGSLFFPFYFGSTFSVLSAGLLSIRMGYKKLIVLCFLILGLSFIALNFVRTYELFIVNLFFLGLGSGLYIPCAIPLITSVFDKKHWGKTISIHETAAGCAILTVPFFAVVALGLMDWHTIFLVFGGVCFLAMFFILAFLPDPRPDAGKLVLIYDLFKQKVFWIVSIAFILLGIASMGIYNIIPLFLVEERGMPLDSANTLFGVSRIGGLIGMILICFILDRFNIKKTLMIIIAVTGISTIGVALVHDHQMLLILLLIQATFSVIFFPAGLMVISKVTDQHSRGFFTAVAMSAAGIFGPGLTPVLLGALADFHSFQIGILIVGLFTTLFVLSLFWFDNATFDHG